MNICILTKSTLAHGIGGTEVHTQILSESIAKLGHSVDVITTRHPEGLEYEEKGGVFFHYLKGTKPACYSRSWWRESAKKIRQLHDKNKFDVILAESFSGYYYAYKTRLLINVPIISIMHGNMIGLIKNGWNSVSSLKEFFNFIIRYLPESIFFYLPLFFKTLRHSDAIVAVSKETAKSLQKEFFINPKKISVIYTGIDTDIFKTDEAKRMTIRRKYSLSDEAKIILMAGIVHKQKGMHIGLEAFIQIKKKIPEAKMMIVGDGPQLAFLKGLAKQLHLENDVIFCGLVPNEEILFYYNAADLLLNPTMRVEGLPAVIIEVMACGLPIVTTRIGGTESTIEEGISGFFVKPKDRKMLAEKSIEILSSPELMAEFGRNARHKAKVKFDSIEMIKGYFKIIESLVERKSEMDQIFYEPLWERRIKYKNTPLGLRMLAAADLAPSGKRLLDVGCGDGATATLIKNKYDEIYGVEFSDKAIEAAKKKGAIVSNINLNQDNLPYEDNFFDTVLTLDVIEHIFEPQRLIRECSRVLKPAGTFIITTPNIRYLYHLICLAFKGRFPRTSEYTEIYDGGHIHYFTFKDIEFLLKGSGFQKIEKFGLYQWEHFNFTKKIKDIIKNILGRNLKREFFSAGIVIRAKKV